MLSRQMRAVYGRQQVVALRRHRRPQQEGQSVQDHHGEGRRQHEEEEHRPPTTGIEDGGSLRLLGNPDSVRYGTVRSVDQHHALENWMKSRVLTHGGNVSKTNFFRFPPERVKK